MTCRNQHSQKELSLILLLAISLVFLLVALGQSFIGTEPVAHQPAEQLVELPA